MTTTIGESENIIIDPESEIRKLQELVKKLEIQNQMLLHQAQDEKDSYNQVTPDLLRTSKTDQSGHVLRQLNGIKTVHDSGDNLTTSEKQSNEKSGKAKVDIAKLSLESVGLIQVDEISLDADDSWLFKSPKQTPGTETAKSPFVWVREDFDQSGDEFASFHRSLYYKLDEVMKHNGNAAVMQNNSDAKTRSEENKNDIDDYGNVIEIISVVPTGPLEMHKSLFSNQRHDDLNVSSSSNPLSIAKDRRTSESGIIKESVHQKVTSASEENLLGFEFRLADVTDVKVLAKMQEDSLRKSFNTPLGASKKVLSKSLNRSSGALADSCEALPESDGLLSKGLNQSTGALLETMNYSTIDNSRRFSQPKLSGDNRSVSRSATSIAFPGARGISKSLASNSLPGTPYGSNHELTKPKIAVQSSSVPHRQSLPNLNRNLKLSVLRSHPSDPRLAVSSNKKQMSVIRQPMTTTRSTTSLQDKRIRPLQLTLGQRNAVQGPIGRGGGQGQGGGGGSHTRKVVAVPTTLSLKRPTTVTTSNNATTHVAPKTPTGKTTPRVTTPSSKGKSLVAATNNVTSAMNTVAAATRTTGIPKPGSMSSKLSIPQKSGLNTSRLTSSSGATTTTTNDDDDDWKEGCF